jgi:hypothetical protein
LTRWVGWSHLHGYTVAKVPLGNAGNAPALSRELHRSALTSFDVILSERIADALVRLHKHNEEYSTDPSPESATPRPCPTRADRTEVSTNLLTYHLNKPGEGPGETQQVADLAS